MGEQASTPHAIEPVMPAQDVVEVVRLLEQNGIEVIVDGGWGVDALLGEQTRLHSDLDIALPHQQVPLARRLLEERGYHDIPRDDTRECNFVLGDKLGHLVDFHSYTFDEQGNLVYGVPYPLDSLAGHGSILGYPVRCITPEWMVRFHSGYKLDEKDYQDVKALALRFGIKLLPEYHRFEERDT